MKGKILALILVLSVFIILANALFAMAPLARFCGFCHGKEYQTWVRSSHRKTRCHHCHQQPGLLGFSIQRIKLLRMVESFTTGLYMRPITSTVSIESCSFCHSDIEQKTIVEKNIRVSHKEFLEEGYECTFCHNTVPHAAAVPSKKIVTMDKCIECHNMKKAPASCEICHVGDGKWERRAYGGSWRISHGKNWRKTHGMDNPATCLVCHGAGFCASCHEIDLPHSPSWPNLHGRIALRISKSCLNCHHQEFCRSCHRIEIPHPDSFLPNHSKVVKKKGEEICLSCHMKDGCVACHERHIHPAVFGVRIPRGR